MTFRYWRFLVANAWLVLLAPPAVASDQPDSIQRTIHVQDSQGNIHTLQPRSSEQARVYVFLTTECPISASYLPVLNELTTLWDGDRSKVSLYGIWADATTTPTEVAAQREHYGMKFPILLDRDHSIAKALKPTRVPEAFVLDANGRIAYRGRIDDRYREVGRARPAATKHDLAKAVSSLLASEPIAEPRTDAVGCLFESEVTSATASEEVTYNRDIAPILYANCVTCHRQGEVGPFPLETYTDASKRAGQIARIVEEKLMPPWKPAEVHGEFVGQRTLTEEQIATIAKWASAGRAEGRPEDLPPIPRFTSGWRLGEPDLVLEMPEQFEIPAGGPDLFQNFVIPLDLPSDKAIAAADFIPGNPRVVHHALFFLDGNGKARELDDATPGPGYPSFGTPGFLPSGSAGGWSPGKTPRRLPDGLGRRVKKGWDLVLQVHYHPSGKPEVDRSKIALYFVDGKAQIAADIWASNHIHDIPPGERDYRLNATYEIPSDLTMLGVVPHMHLLGRTMKATAVLPDGTRKQLIEIPDWDFNWQDDYRFASPIHLPAGTRLEVEATYDNSEDNPSNPSSPPKRVTWGEGTTDEMLYCFFLVTTKESRDLNRILGDVLKHEIVGQIIGRSLNGRRVRQPGDPARDLN